jgi:Na+-transporting methylmalonyl-CoA/oxaloacetate decarboxylase gamma subunit
MSAITFSILIAAMSFIGAVILSVLAYRAAKKSAINKIKHTNSRLSATIEKTKNAKAFTLAK